MGLLAQKVESESVAALAALREAGRSFDGVQVWFEYARPIFVGRAEVSGEPPRIVLTGHSLDAVNELEKARGGSAKLWSFEFESTTACGLFGNEERTDTFTYSVESRQQSHSTHYKR